MQNSRNITVYTAKKRTSLSWDNHSTTWEAFAGFLKTPVRSEETEAQYKKLKRSEQVELKDQGGFVGGSFAGSSRTKSAVTGRDLITIDLDNAQPGETDTIMAKVERANIGAVVYSTRSHTAQNPRLRVIICLKETVLPDEYEPLARMTAKKLGLLGNCDHTTFQASRLMFNPSCCADSDYIYKVWDKPLLDGKKVLESFDWKDVANWPQCPNENVALLTNVRQQADPLQKKGIVGAFCKAYNIHEAIEKFLGGIYTKASDNRYTYVAGSTVGGAVVYDDKFIYSHHATDPCSCMLCNSFDLVRTQLYGKLDNPNRPDRAADKAESWTAFVQALTFDPKVMAIKMADDAGKNEDGETDWTPTEDDFKALDVKANGDFKATINNFIYIIQHNPSLKDRIANDVFSSQMVARGGMSWDKGERKTRLWSDDDDAQLTLYFEKTHKMKNEGNLLSAIKVVAHDNQFNPVEDYLRNLLWDGTKRIDDLLSVYLGAEKNVYTRDVMRATLAGAIGRAIVGGTKWDYCPILVGPQGIGKSTFLAKLGGEWFSDSLQSFEGKEASELIQGTWINELPELAAFNKSETNKIKQFLTKTHDIYRPAYARRVEKRPRRCIFFGSTNDDEFLRDYTGNRRYWPINLDPSRAELPISALTPDVVDQIWAEAYQLWKNKEVDAFLKGEAEEMARQAQEEHRLRDEWEGVIRRYLETPVPIDWQKRSLKERRLVLNGTLDSTADSKITQISINEIWCEAFGREPVDLDQTDRRRIAAIMRNIEGWEPHAGLYTSYSGRQKGYRRVRETGGSLPPSED